MPSTFKRFGEKLKQQLNINSGSTKVGRVWVLARGRQCLLEPQFLYLIGS